MSRSISESALGVDDIIDLGADHVVLATGAAGRNDALFDDGNPGRQLDHARGLHARRHRRRSPAAKARRSSSISTITTWAACSPSIWRAQGIDVTYVTPAGQASAWTIMTNELPLVHRALAQRRVPVTTLHLSQGVRRRDGDAGASLHRRGNAALPAARC